MQAGLIFLKKDRWGMTAAIQRVSQASFSIGGQVKGQIGAGFLVLQDAKIADVYDDDTVYVETSVFNSLQTPA